MTVVRLLLLLPLLLATSCASLDPGPPPVDIVALSEVIADLQLAQSITTEIPVAVRDSMQAVYHESVLAEHGLTRRSFDSLLWIVRQEPQWIDTVYSRAGELIARKMVE
ncbi:hypothetical protein LEM8419_03233 [Neolewinella maritima]|uniref:DUF4296 domain-containing protein n=1 Tax=Neolewinella maritima TaxID=1383882 RepID=A0ABM9B4X3_9BACT|nr:hypothetical protein [Neolewinella maritima]CAH1002326.1 hypothetical protein LEM8419_03233 [Neolewinella maritima]